MQERIEHILGLPNKKIIQFFKTFKKWKQGVTVALLASQGVVKMAI